MSTDTFNSFADWAQTAQKLELNWVIDTELNDSPAKARNILVSKFLASFESTHLLFISPDVKFESHHVLQLLSAEKHIISYNKPVLPGLIVEGELAQSDIVGTDFTLISKEAFSHLSKHQEVIPYRDTNNSYLKTFFGTGPFFDESMSDDELFCNRWFSLGGKVWIHAAVKITDK